MRKWIFIAICAVTLFGACYILLADPCMRLFLFAYVTGFLHRHIRDSN